MIGFCRNGQICRRAYNFSLARLAYELSKLMERIQDFLMALEVGGERGRGRRILVKNKPPANLGDFTGGSTSYVPEAGLEPARLQ